MYGQDREAIREVFFRAWRKYRQRQPLAGIESVIITIANQHPEYHNLLEQPELSQRADFASPMETENPFLHMGLHIALAEQLALNRPTGIQAVYQRLLVTSTDDHAAQHQMMACLEQAVGRAQQAKRPPDEAAYLACLRQLP